MRQETLALVEIARTGDKKAFSRLVEAHRRIAAGVAYGILADPHLAADAVQEAFFKAYRGLAQLKDSQRFVPWFLAIVRSTSTDMARRRVRWGSREVPMGDGLADGVADLDSSVTLGGSVRDLGPQEALLQREEALRIRAALLSLSDEHREVIVLKHLQGHSYREIARLLKTTVRAVESRLFRARQQLNRALASHRGEGEAPGRQVRAPVNGRDAAVPESGPRTGKRV